MTTLHWDGCVNVRDLGGLPTEDGRSTRAGVIVRSDNIRALTDAGWRALADHGVTRIVDLRWPEELAGDEPREVHIDVVHVSVFGEAFDEDYVAELDAHLASVEDVAEHYAWSYVDCLERNRERFGAAVAAVADGDAAVVVHCMGGRDRTGIVSALLLRVAGVGRETIGADYALSGDNLAARNERWIADAPDEAERAKRRRLAPTPAAAMVHVLEEIERRYGDVASYLRAAGVTDAQLGALRERLVS